jgi:hypothetical protein
MWPNKRQETLMKTMEQHTGLTPELKGIEDRFSSIGLKV